MSATEDKKWLYAVDLSDAEWHSVPGALYGGIEIAYPERGAVAMRNTEDRETVTRYTEAEWEAGVLGAQDSEFDPDR
ncbi:DUF397 domain-containing protein [Streptomyces sp. NPDC058335]|uniref:DUF397 domain-containing protein n=1 Tax=Streptomyces sp. NPDC058335 TaxID=3346451 RepID=UPI00366085C7